MRQFFSIVGMALFSLLLPLVLWVIQPNLDFQMALISNSSLPASRQSEGVEWFNKQQKLTYHKYNLAKEKIQVLSDYELIYMQNDDSYLLSEAEWEVISSRINQSSPNVLLGEFGVLHNTENLELMDTISQEFGIQSSQWVGKFFKDLSLNNPNHDIPEHIIKKLPSWDYKGSGLIFVNNQTGESLVLPSDDYMTAKNVDLLGTGIFKQGVYHDWFDVVSTNPNAETLITLVLNVNSNGRKLLEEIGIPTHIPAVTLATKNHSKRYYACGRFSEVIYTPYFYQYLGIRHVYGVIEYFSENNVFWSSFYPIISNMIDQFSDEYKSYMKGEEPFEPLNQSRINPTTSQFEVRSKDSNWQELTLKGVNIGMAKPGTFPGNAAITYEEYYRWFELISAMNANHIRVYTLHPPVFYKALADFNAVSKNPLYVMHGVWINEEWITENQDAYHEDAINGFRQEMQHIVDAVHGNATIQAKAGHSSGVYTSDISNYVIGWIIGTEWDPFMVQGTNIKYSTIGQYDGKYFKTEAARPFEYWLAEQMDYLVTYQFDKYHKIDPMSFTNWVTTDLLTHPSDDSNQEDIVSVNPNVIQTKGLMKPIGQFASYHVYPYYPEFLQYDTKYQGYLDQRGKENQYAAYLHELRAAHQMPVYIAEFGAPSSRGRTHSGPDGKHQGGISEESQGIINKELFEDIIAEDYLGGAVFVWQDEWFKRTWNTMDYDNPSRRPFWSNAQTSEQQFGLLSFDRHKIKVDGESEDWSADTLYDDSTGRVKGLKVDHDERYLYLSIDLELTDPDRLILTFDTIPEQGNLFIKGIENLDFTDGIDFVAEITTKESRLTLDAYYDYYSYLYGNRGGFINPIPRNQTINSGQFNKIRFVLNDSIFLKDSGKTIPYTDYETGLLQEGNGNPASSDYNSLTDYAVGDSTIEIRIPWLLLQFRDPSHKEVIGNYWLEDDVEASTMIESIGIGMVLIDDTGIVQTFPSNIKMPIAPFRRYSYDNWEEPLYQERLKKSYDIMQETFNNY